MFLAGALVAMVLYEAAGFSLWLTLPVILGLGFALGWYGSASIDVPLEEL